MRNVLILPIMAGAALVAAPAYSASYVVHNTTLATDIVFAPTLATSDIFQVDGFISAAGALSNTVTFTLGSGATGIGGSAIWFVNTAADPFRLVGVNVDILNLSDVVQASDTFGGVNSGVASSTLLANLTPGTYKVRITGNSLGTASYVIGLSVNGLIPEPATWSMMIIGFMALGIAVRQRGRAQLRHVIS